MTSSHSLRLHDQAHFSYKNRNDFAIRPFGMSSGQVVRFLVATLAAIGIATLAVYKDIILLEQDNGSNHGLLLGGVLCLITGIVLYIAAGQIELHKKGMESAQFMNALFASVLTKGYEFCLIVSQEGINRVLYCDMGSQKLFSELMLMPERTLEMLLDRHFLMEEDRNAIYQAVINHKNLQITSQIKSAEGMESSLVVSIEAIKRPVGFTMIRGKKE